MDVDGTNVTVILLRDASGSMVPYRIDEVFSLVDARDGSVSDYTALVRMDGSDTEPVIVRALDAEIPSFVGIEDADELERVSSEYQALVNRRNLRLI